MSGFDKIDEMAGQARFAAAEAARAAREAADAVATEARELTRATGEKLKAAGIELIDLGKK